MVSVLNREYQVEVQAFRKCVCVCRDSRVQILSLYLPIWWVYAQVLPKQLCISNNISDLHAYTTHRTVGSLLDTY